MTKQELLEYIAKRADALVGEAMVTQTNQTGDVFYCQNVRKVLGNAVSYENICFVVIDEKGPSEMAYFFETDEIRFLNVQENPELRAKLFPINAKPGADIPDVIVKP